MKYSCRACRFSATLDRGLALVLGLLMRGRIVPGCALCGGGVCCRSPHLCHEVSRAGQRAYRRSPLGRCWVSWLRSPGAVAVILEQGMHNCAAVSGGKVSIGRVEAVSGLRQRGMTC